MTQQIFEPPSQAEININGLSEPLEAVQEMAQQLNDIFRQQFLHSHSHQFRTGFDTDLVDDSQTRITAAEGTIETNSTAIAATVTSITTLSQSVEELEEVIVMFQKRLRSLVSTLEKEFLCLKEHVETS